MSVSFPGSFQPLFLQIIFHALSLPLGAYNMNVILLDVPKPLKSLYFLTFLFSYAALSLGDSIAVSSSLLICSSTSSNMLLNPASAFLSSVIISA